MVRRLECRPRLQDGPVCTFCETAVQYVKIALANNQTVAQIEHSVDQLCDSAFAGLDLGPAQASSACGCRPCLPCLFLDTSALPLTRSVSQQIVLPLRALRLC